MKSSNDYHRELREARAVIRIVWRNFGVARFAVDPRTGLGTGLRQAERRGWAVRNAGGTCALTPAGVREALNTGGEG